MSDATIVHMHNDLEELKRDIAVIKHILSEEGKLSVSAEKELEEARAVPDSEYVSHKELKKRILKVRIKHEVQQRKYACACHEIY